MFHKKIVDTDNSMTIEVNGMTCGGCANKINQNLVNVNGVTSVDAQHEKNYVIIGGSFDLQDVKKTISELGFQCQK